MAGLRALAGHWRDATSGRAALVGGEDTERRRRAAARARRTSQRPGVGRRGPGGVRRAPRRRALRTSRSRSPSSSARSRSTSRRTGRTSHCSGTPTATVFHRTSRSSSRAIQVWKRRRRSPSASSVGERGRL